MKSWTAPQLDGAGGRVRTERVRGAIRQEIAEMLLRQELRDPRLTGFISITEVRLSPDLQYATVYFSVVEEQGAALLPAGEPAIDTAQQPTLGVDRVRACQQALTHAAGFIRSQLGRRIQLRHIPHLRFLPDNSLEYGMRMNRLLGSLHIPPAEEGETSSPRPTEAR
ncbi:MAG: ribosome-binding factor A [Magnetococcus sp. MYC-9]